MFVNQDSKQEAVSTRVNIKLEGKKKNKNKSFYYWEKKDVHTIKMAFWLESNLPDSCPDFLENLRCFQNLRTLELLCHIQIPTRYKDTEVTFCAFPRASTTPFIHWPQFRVFVVRHKVKCPPTQECSFAGNYQL